MDKLTRMALRSIIMRSERDAGNQGATWLQETIAHVGDADLQDAFDEWQDALRVMRRRAGELLKTADPVQED